MRNTKINLDLLNKASKDILIELRNDANENLKSLHDSENVITNKANGLLQILFPLFIAIFGFIVSEFISHKNIYLLFFAICIEIIIAICCYNLFEILVPKTTALLGAKPSNNLDVDIIENSTNEENVNEFLKIKVYSLENAIAEATNSHLHRSKLLERALKILIIGTAIVAIIFLQFLLGRFLSECK